MKRSTVRCRCGHQVLAKEVLRTDMYERPSGREYVYVKYRCKRCKRVGETFVAENRWDWRIFEAPRSEMSESELDAFAEKSPITSEDLLDFHCLLEDITTATELAAFDCEPRLDTDRELLLLEHASDAEAVQETTPENASESTPDRSTLDNRNETKNDGKPEVPLKPARLDARRVDFKSGNDGLNSNSDPNVKKDAGKKDDK